MMAAASVFFAGAMTSCVSSDDPTTVVTPTQDQLYQSAFINAFGNIAANQTWGFGEDNAETIVFDENRKIVDASASARSLVGTRGVNANGNEWGLYVNVPQPLTEEQKDVVTKWFKEHQNPQGVAVNWSDFFVQQVYTGEWSGNMNFLYCGSDTDHTFNFNAGDAGVYRNVCYGLQEGATDQNQRVYGSDKIEFMVDSSTEYFGFHNSFDSNFYADNYVIIPGDEIDPIVAGMYFVGFDFEANGQAENQQVARDFYFDNWIVKITPGDYKVGQRVFVEDLIAKTISEDLGNIDGSDWDFNDAVFDVFFEKSYWPVEKITAVITLRAAGGTLPLYIAGKEIHQAFGVSTNTIVNTVADDQSIALDHTTAPIVVFRADVTVEDANALAARVVNEDGRSIQLKSETGKATQKFAIPVTAKWLKETTLFTEGYPDFRQWVNDGQTEWWNNGVAAKLY